MRRRALGRSGYEVSEVGLGCWQLGNDFGPVTDERADQILAAADDAGIDLWDTADVYGDGLSEQRIGSYVAGHPGARVVATKVGRDPALFPDGYTRAGVRACLEASARRLGVDTLDLAQLHCVPTAVLTDGDLLSWMEEFRDQGLVRHVGVSVETMDEARFAVAHPAVVSIQIIFNILRQDAVDQLLPHAAANDVGIIVRLPLASGVLSGRMTRDRTFAETDHRNFNRDGAAFHVGETFAGLPFERAVDLAADVAAITPSSMSPAQMAMRWVLDHPEVTTVIAGATRPEQVTENASASDLDPLGDDLHRQLGDFYRSEVEPHIRGPR